MAKAGDARQDRGRNPIEQILREVERELSSETVSDEVLERDRRHHIAGIRESLARMDAETQRHFERILRLHLNKLLFLFDCAAGFKVNVPGFRFYPETEWVG